MLAHAAGSYAQQSRLLGCRKGNCQLFQDLRPDPAKQCHECGVRVMGSVAQPQTFGDRARIEYCRAVWRHNDRRMLTENAWREYQAATLEAGCARIVCRDTQLAFMPGDGLAERAEDSLVPVGRELE